MVCQEPCASPTRFPARSATDLTGESSSTTRRPFSYLGPEIATYTTSWPFAWAVTGGVDPVPMKS